MSTLYADETFSGRDFTSDSLAKGEYENCIFKNCRLSGADLRQVVFSECQFEQCDLSNAKVTDTAFKNIHFKDCKLLGVAFSECNTFLLELRFSGCHLNLASFYQLKLKGIRFTGCNLREADFTEADCTNAVFADCDLSGTVFDRTRLDKADLRTAMYFSINPEINQIKKAHFSQSNISGLISHLDIRID